MSMQYKNVRNSVANDELRQAIRRAMYVCKKFDNSHRPNVCITGEPSRLPHQHAFTQNHLNQESQSSRTSQRCMSYAETCSISSSFMTGCPTAVFLAESSSFALDNTLKRQGSQTFEESFATIRRTIGRPKGSRDKTPRRRRAILNACRQSQDAFTAYHDTTNEKSVLMANQQNFPLVDHCQLWLHSNPQTSGMANTRPTLEVGLDEVEADVVDISGTSSPANSEEIDFCWNAALCDIDAGDFQLRTKSLVQTINESCFWQSLDEPSMDSRSPEETILDIEYDEFVLA